MKKVILFAFAILAAFYSDAQIITLSNLRYVVNGEGSVALIGSNTTQSSILRVPTNIVSQGSSYRVSSIRARAFSGQGNIMTLVLPEQLDTIGQDAFYGCQKLRNIMGLSKVDVCEAYAFAMTGLVSLDWSQVSIGTLGDGVFAQCKKLTDISLPAELNSLPEAIFCRCTSLTSVNISSLPLTQIGPRAFAQCSSLQQLELPATLIGIGDEAFANMSALTSIELPAAVTSIGAQAFVGCSSLQTLEMPEQLVSLGYSPFAGCNSLREVTLSSIISDIDDKFVFADCPVLESINIDSNAQYYRSTDGVLRNRLNSKIIAYPAALSRQIHPTLRATSQPLAPGALMDCELDEVLILPAQVNSLPREAFAGTSGLKKLEMPSRSNLTTIGIRAFENSRDLMSVVFPSKLKTISNAAFSGDDSILDVYTLATSVPSLSETAFSQTVFENAVLHTPEDKSEVYSAAPGWCLFRQIEDGNATGIESFNAKESEESVFYNMQGIRVANPRKGIYLINHRKVMIR
ncbi:MAG: leucine-rich repeat domain-containing protein [Bacteroidaceae bacterium]|nr:leucine-rich repeat domain-containing protein [Bacteroidaceae bacterium]